MATTSVVATKMVALGSSPPRTPSTERVPLVNSTDAHATSVATRPVAATITGALVRMASAPRGTSRDAPATNYAALSFR